MSSSIYPWNTAYTPFFRRFTDERTRDINDTIQLYNEVRAAFYNGVWCNPNAVKNLSDTLAEELCKIVELPGSHDIGVALDKCQQAVLALETSLFNFPEIDWTQPLSLKEQVDLRRFLRAKRHFLQNDDQITETLVTAVGNVMGGIIQELPSTPEATDDAVFTAPLITVVPNPNELVDKIIGTLSGEELSNAGLFDEVQTRFYENACTYSGIEPYENSKKRIIPPLEAELSPEELVDAYLIGTPFHELLLAPFPLTIPEELLIEQNRSPYDGEHPKHHCYQCHRPLPPDFAMKYWQVLTHPRGPFFDVEKCKTTAVNRHISGGIGPSDAYANLVVEYNLYVQKYEDKKRQKDDEVMRREEEKQEQLLRREQEAQERHEDRDYRDWQRDQERAETEWKREQEKLLKEQEKEAERLAKEQAFQDLLVPKPIPDKIRYEHSHILGPQGSGKTTLIQEIVINDLRLKNPPAYIIIDPKGFMVERLSQLDVFHPEHGRLRDRLIIIDPAHQPALNMFDIPLNRFSPQQQEAILNQLLETFAYVFTAAGSSMSQRMSIPFAFVMRLVFFMGGDLNTLMDVLEDDKKQKRFASQIADFVKTDETGAARRFFDRSFYTDAFTPTREQITTRLYEISSRPQLAKMFLAPENKLNIIDCIQNRKIVLVNTGMSYLGNSGSQLLGRYIITMAMNAAFARYFIPKEEWSSAYVMIDEFQDYADETNTPKLLRLVREYNMGITMAHQSMHPAELNEAIRTSISTSAIKYCASPEGVDLNYMARDLKCEPAFLSKQQVSNTHVNFACYVRGMSLEHPFVVSVPIGNIDREPTMTRPDNEALIKINDQKLSSTRATKTPETQKTPDAPAPLKPHPQSAPTEADKPIVPPQPLSDLHSTQSSQPHPDAGTHTDPAIEW